MNFLVVAVFAAIFSALVSVSIRRVPIPIFKAFLVFELALGVVSLWTQGNSRLAISTWMWGQFLTAGLWTAVFLEIRHHVLEGYPRIGRIATYFVLAATCLGSGLIWLTTVDDIKLPMRLAVFVPRVFAGVLFVAMTILGGLMKHHPTDHQPNIEVHARLFWFFMGAQAISLWSTNLAPIEFIGLVTSVKMVFSILCFGSWAVLMVPHKHIVFVPTMSAADLRAAQLRSDRALDELRDFTS